MIDQAPDDNKILRRLVAAGDAGLPVGGTDLPLSVATRMEDARLAVLIQNGNALRAVATSRGGQFAYRVAS